ncbi:MAG: histidine kinase [Gaiellales bacterium]
MEAPSRTDLYRSWLLGELVLVGALALGTYVLWMTKSLSGYAVRDARLALDTTVVVVAAIVCVLAAIKFLVEGRALDLAISGGFFVATIGAAAFEVVPTFGVAEPTAADAWGYVATSLVATSLIAGSPFTDRRLSHRARALTLGGLGLGGVIAGIWVLTQLPGAIPGAPDAQTLGERFAPAYALLALLAVAAAIGFGLRFRRFGRDLDSWLALALTLIVFADLHYILAPIHVSQDILLGDFLRLLSYAVLLVGVWRAISQAEFGRAVADERARVAEEIHDGLAQYLFAISTHVSMLEAGSPLEKTLPKLKAASVAAQHEARYAVLALSSASGTAPFDAALRRYVEVLTADGALDVDLELDRSVALAPDEQIEIFRIVQEGLANARKHAGATRAWVRVVHRNGQRIVTVRDDGMGFDGESTAVGQGLKSMRRRAASIEGGFVLRSAPRRGTEIEIVLRAA